MSNPTLAPATPSGFRLPRLQELGLVVVVLVLGTLLTAYGHYHPQGDTNSFLNLDNLIGQVATYMAVYAIMAVGVTCVIITGGIDISVGSIYGLSAMCVAGVLQNLSPETPAWKSVSLALLVGPGVGLVCGLINGGLVVALRLHPFIVTLGTLSIYRGIANIMTPLKTFPGQGKAIPDSYTQDFFQRFFFESAPGEGGVQIMAMIFMLIVVALGWFYLRLMVAGRENYAIGGNEEAARFSGIRVNLVKLRVYAISGLTAGIAGVVSVGIFGTASSNTGSGYELMVIASAVVGGASLVGGRGTAFGALLGALIIRLIENAIFITHQQQDYNQIIIGSAIIIAVSLDRISEYARERRALLRRARKIHAAASTNPQLQKEPA